MQATAEMQAHCEAVRERVRQHLHTLTAALADSDRRAAGAAHSDGPPLRRGDVPCVVETPLAQLLGVVRPSAPCALYGVPQCSSAMVLCRCYCGVCMMCRQ